MTRKLKDTSPRFDRNKSYAIGLLQGKSLPSDVPERFATSPIRPLYLSGTDLLGNGMKSCRDFLMSSNCHFKIGSAVHFYEVEYKDEEQPIYKNIFIGSPLQQPIKEQPQVNNDHNLVQQSMISDVKEPPVINNIIPNYYSNEHEKLLFKTQNDAITYYQKCLLEERKQFSEERKQFGEERNIYIQKIDIVNDEVVKLNIKINELQSANEGLNIKYDESKKFIERLTDLHDKFVEPPPPPIPEPQGLADKGIAMIDGMLGDGSSQQIVGGIATGIGNGIGKLIDLGVDYIKDKKILVNN